MATHGIEIRSSGEVTLEGRLDIPSTGPAPRGVVAVCHPHPLYGGDMNNNVVGVIASALLARGIGVLRFNFRGVGGSTGDHDGGVGEGDDAVAALEFLASTNLLESPMIGLAGYSFGGGVALDVALRGQGLAALALVSPAGGDRGETDYGVLTMPKLLLTGETDEFATVERVQALAALLPAPTETHVAPQTDHFWWGAEEEMGRRVGDFFATAFGG